MLNIRRIIWTYQHFGVVCALKVFVYDIEALLLYILYTLTLPFQFLWILYRVSRKDK